MNQSEQQIACRFQQEDIGKKACICCRYKENFRSEFSEEESPFDAVQASDIPKLKEGDDNKGLAFCQKNEEMIENDESDPLKTTSTDESRVYLKRSPNKQNNHEWSLSKPESRSLQHHKSHWLVKVNFDDSY